jgi:trimethylamine--corrinoid protein Co-methyltransferase
MQREQLQAIHEAGLEILARTGVVFQDDETVRRLAAHGFSVDGSRVLMTADQVATAIATTPSSFSVAGRHAARDVTIGGGGVVVANGSGAACIAERGDLRALTANDICAWVRLCHQLPNLDLLGYLLAAASAGDTDYLRSVHDSITLTDKPYEFPVMETWHLQAALDIQEILWGADWHARPRLFVVLNTTSPLIVSGPTCVAAHQLALRQQPLCVTPCAMGGTTGPATLAGLLALQHAETLAGLVLIQLAQPGAPFLYGGFSGSAHLATGDLMVGAPQFWAIAAATVELAKSLGLPVRAGAGVTDAHALDMQAGIETAMGLAAVLDRGVDFILHAEGTVGSINAVSFEKLAIDDELIGMLRRRPLDIPVDDETLALDVVASVGPGGSFLSQKHTRRHGRDYPPPALFNRRPYVLWKDEGRDLAAAAAARVQALLESYEEPEMDELVRRQFDRYCSDGGPGR